MLQVSNSLRSEFVKGTGSILAKIASIRLATVAKAAHANFVQLGHLSKLERLEVEDLDLVADKEPVWGWLTDVDFCVTQEADRQMDLQYLSCLTALQDLQLRTDHLPTMSSSRKGAGQRLPDQLNEYRMWLSTALEYMTTWHSLRFVTNTGSRHATLATHIRPVFMCEVTRDSFSQIVSNLEPVTLPSLYVDFCDSESAVPSMCGLSKLSAL